MHYTVCINCCMYVHVYVYMQCCHYTQCHNTLVDIYKQIVMQYVIQSSAYGFVRSFHEVLNLCVKIDYQIATVVVV